MSNKAPFSEVIESSLDSFTGQCWQWNYFPKFGSLVSVESNNHIIYGCVVQVQTGSSDPSRTPFAYQKTEEELLAQQPQIFEFLRTTFNVQIVGYRERDCQDFLYLLAPQPSKIHAFVQECSGQILSQFFANPDFLHVLFAFQSKIPNLDELLLAILRQLAQQKSLSSDILKNFCQTFSLLTGNDYRRLKLFLKRIGLVE